MKKLRVRKSGSVYYVERLRNFLGFKYWANEFPASDMTTGHFSSEDDALFHLEWLKNEHYSGNKVIKEITL